jgi:hypothetical protein
MTDNSQENFSPGSSSTASPVVMPTDVATRRRMLLSGLGKGSAVLAAAAAPMHSLACVDNGKTIAHPTDGKHYHAKVSRCASPIGSQKTAQDLPECEGYGTNHYQQGGKSCWPKYPLDTRVSCYDKKFSDVFPGANGTCSDKKFGDIVAKHWGTAECRWVLAYVNSITCADRFPYEYYEITGNLWQGHSGSREDCQKFFSTFCESRRA